GGQLDRLAPTLDLEMKLLVGAHADDALHLTEVLDRRAVDLDHEVAGPEARALGGAAGIDDVDLGRGAPLAEEGEDRREDDNGEHEIGDRPGGDNGGAGAKRLALETVLALLLAQRFERPLPCARCILVVDEFHIAAERDPGEPPARPVPVVEADDLRPETDRECLDRHAAPAGHKKMAELVEEYHDGEHEEEGEQIRQHGVAEA